MLSENAQFFIDKCFKGKEIRAINPLFNVKYEEDNRKYILNESVLKEILKSDRVKVTHMGKMSINLVGIEGKSKD